MERPIRIPADISLGFGEIYGSDVRGNGWNYSGKRHTGIDYAVPEGTEVFAAEAGAVDFAGFDRTGYGNLIKIGHAGGIGSKYAHLSKILVKRWQRVAKGELIGISGATGNVTGAHLHFETTENGKAVDPNLFFDSVSDPAATASQSMTASAEAESQTGQAGAATIAVELANIRPEAGAAGIVGQLRQGTEITIGAERKAARGLVWRKGTVSFWIAEADASGTEIFKSAGESDAR
ncbi:hypothetical protein BEQ56_00695 [Anaerolineaceae bacterium oral taxon 439]|nr:hypothetical protein BEQ56_00695 [Anaerolineaceae bacterium oral taxon 439]